MTEPELLAERSEGPHKRVLRFRLPPGLFYFQGHFPAAPLLAGVVQIDWAIRYGRERFPCKGGFKRMEAVKFQKILQPGSEFELALEHAPDKGALFFRYQTDQLGHHSSGRVFFGD